MIQYALFLTIISMVQCKNDIFYFPDQMPVQSQKQGINNQQQEEIIQSQVTNLQLPESVAAINKAQAVDIQNSAARPQVVESPEYRYPNLVQTSPATPLYTSPELNASDLSAIRGTEMYEKAVDNIVATGILKTAVALNKVILQHSREPTNIVFAPVSITAALALILLGSNGKTFNEITTLMGFATGITNMNEKSQIVHEQFGRTMRKIERESGIVLGKQATFASGIFVQDNFPIRALYKQTAESIYQSEILNLDFRGNPGHASKIINAWVSDRTGGKITEIIGHLSPATKVVIASAMYFKAEWEQKFFPGATTRRPFYINGRQSKSNIEVEMMANGGYFPYYRDRSLGCEIMGFPYKGGKSTMYVVLPFNSTAEVLKQFELQLTAETLNRLADETDYTGGTILFPKMKLESTLDLKEPLEVLGVKSLFSAGDANLALLSPGTHAPITPYAPIDKAHIPVNSVVKNPIAVDRYSENDNDVLIFSRNGIPKNCTRVFNSEIAGTSCVESLDVAEPLNRVPKKLEQRIIEQVETLDTVRNLINRQSTDNNFQNPGLYADQVIHKVFMDITEKGTEGAAATGVALTRDGSRVSFRADVPFFFFVRHEDTKTVLFWGSVVTPTPSYTV